MKIAARHLERCKEIALLLLKYGRVDLVNALGMQEAIELRKPLRRFRRPPRRKTTIGLR